MEDREVRERVARVESLLDELDAVPDPVVRERATATVAALVELYGEGLARVVERLPAESLQALVRDELVEQLLLLHGLHPVDAETRVRRALADVRDVELVAVEEEVVRLRLGDGCAGCGSAAARRSAEEAVAQAAPDLELVFAGDERATGIPLPMAGAGA